MAASFETQTTEVAVEVVLTAEIRCREKANGRDGQRGWRYDYRHD
jgi:hypothetical protein